MSRPKGSISQENREKLIQAARMRRTGMSLPAIAKNLGLGLRTVQRWSATGLFELQGIDSPREVLEQLMSDPSPTVRLNAAKCLFALEEVPTAESAPGHDAVLYDPPDYEPPPGLERPCAVLVCWT